MVKPRRTVMLDDADKFRLDYEQTTHYFHELASVRFKLLAIVPIVTGAAIAFLEAEAEASVQLGVAVIGLLATVGVMFYDQRNTAIYDAMQKRAKMLEAILQFERWDDTKKCGGAFLGRPTRDRRFYGIPMWHDLGLAIIYSSAVSGWVYLLAHAFLGSDGLLLSGAVSVAVWLLTFFGLKRLDDPTDEREAMPADLRPLIWPDEDDEGESDHEA